MTRYIEEPIPEWSLWLRAETEEEAVRRGEEWVASEPNLEFVRIVSSKPREFDGIWTVVVEATFKVREQPTLGLVP